MTQTEIMNRAIRIANGAGLEPHSSPVIDNAFLAEDLFPVALREAVKNDPENNKRTYSLSVVSGEVDLPGTILEEWLDDSVAYASNDANILASYEPEYVDYLRSQFSYPQLAYYTVRGDKLCFRAAGQTIGGTTATVNLVAVAIPDIPASLTGEMTISTELAEATIVKLAEMMRGVK